MINFVHLFPYQLGLNGERGNLDCLQTRLRWAGLDSVIHEVTSEGELPKSVDAVFIGSGTLSGALDALERIRSFRQSLSELANSGVPVLALGLGWEILGQELEFVDGSKVEGLGIYPSRSRRVSQRASCESFGFDRFGNLTVGYSNHSAEIELLDNAQPLIELAAGYGNSSQTKAPEASGEGLILGNLVAARLNGPLFPLNPHLADAFLDMMAKRSGFVYNQQSDQAKEVDQYSLNARTDLRKRLLS